MNLTRPLLLAAVVSLSSLAACRVNPCADGTTSLPPSLSPVGAALEGGAVCHAERDEATIMYWGGSDRMSEVTTRAIVKLHAQGWDQKQLTWPSPGLYVFRRGKEELSLRFQGTQTPRFGAKFWTDSITIHAHRYDAKGR